MSVLSLQRCLKDHILNATPQRRAVWRGDPTAGLAVYHHAYRAQLLACLHDTYEKTWAWLGDEQFDAAAGAYIAATTPSSWTLDAYGESFSDFLQTRYPDDLEVGELAWLDWALRRAFDGENAEPIHAEALQAVNWSNAVLTFVPTLVTRLITTNVAAIWGALAEAMSPPAVEPLPRPASLRVWRLGLSPQYRSIDPLEHAAIDRLRGGQSFGEVCEAIGDGLDEAVATELIGSILAVWIHDGIIVDASSPRA